MDIKARMPGIVIAISVKEGDIVNVRDTLCIIDAMKMEQEIACPVKGQVKKVNISIEERIKTGQILFVIE